MNQLEIAYVPLEYYINREIDDYLHICFRSGRSLPLQMSPSCHVKMVRSIVDESRTSRRDFYSVDREREKYFAIL